MKILISIIGIMTFGAVFAYAQPPNKAAAYYDFGVFAYQDGDYQDAEKNLKKATELDPANPAYHHFLGKIYLKTGRYQDAARHFKIADEKNPNLPELRYDRAMLSFKTEDYAAASELFTEVFLKDPSQILARYHAAVSLFKLKRCQEAVTHFEDIARKSSSLSENCMLYAGICYLESEESDKGIEKFEYIRNHTQSEEMRKNAMKWLEVAQKQKKTLKPYMLYFKSSYQHDDNVRLQPADALADTKDMVLEVYLLGRYNLLNEQNKKLSVGYTHYQSFHKDFSEYDMTGSIFSLSFAYFRNPFRFEISYLPSYYWVDENRYLMREQIRPQLTWTITPKLTTRFSLSYAGNEYFEGKDRDGDSREFAIDVYYTMNIGYVYAGSAYEDYTAGAEYESYQRRMAKLGLSVNLPLGVNLDLMGKFTDKPYRGIYPSYDSARKDRQYYGSVTLSRNLLYPWLSVGLEFSVNRNESDIYIYDYTQKAVGLSLTAVY